eukprot:UN0436
MQASVEAATKANGPGIVSLQRTEVAVLSAVAEHTQGDSNVCKQIRLRWRFEISMWGIRIRGPLVKDIAVAMDQRKQFQELLAAKPESSRCPPANSDAHFSQNMANLDAHFCQIQRLWETIAGVDLPENACEAFEVHRTREAKRWAAHQENVRRDSEVQDRALLFRIGKLLDRDERARLKADTARRAAQRRQLYAEKRRTELESQRRVMVAFKPQAKSSTAGPLERLVR